MIILGRKPVLEALRSKAPLTKIYVQFGVHGDVIDQIKQLAQQRNISVQEINHTKMLQYSENAETQGVLAIRSSYRPWSLEKLVETTPLSPYPLLLALDTVQDPQNVGAMIRSAEAFGVAGIICTKHQSAPINETVTKTSAGTLELVRLSIVDNLVQSLEHLKSKGYWIVGTSLKATQDVQQVRRDVPLVLVMGNEQKGMRPLVERTCDFLVKIPMPGTVNSLNVSVAAGICLYELATRR